MKITRKISTNQSSW